MQPNCRPANFAMHFTLRALVPLFSLLLLFFSPLVAKAQGPGSFWIPPIDLQNPSLFGDSNAVAAIVSEGPLQLIVDTDPGVDDAIALTWLLSQAEADVNFLGIVAVAGNTTVENATNNVLTVLQKVGISDVQVVTGANKPLSQKLSATGKLIHGKDGLWGLQDPYASASTAKDARQFYCSNARQQDPDHPITILALGPLTNIATAIRHCPRDMKKYSRIVILGGAKFGGNTTPVAEFNFWQDPEAAQIVLNSGLNIDLVTLDAFTQLTFNFDDICSVSQSELSALRYLSPALLNYAVSQLAAGVEASIPDLAAAIYALDGFGASVPALVKVVDRPDSVRGQSIIGPNLGLFSSPERLTMIADAKELDEIANEAFADSDLPNYDYIFGKIAEIMLRVDDNAQFVRNIDEGTMRTLFLNFVAPNPNNPNLCSVQSEGALAVPQPENHIFLPSVNAD